MNNYSQTKILKSILKIFENRLDIDYAPSCEISIDQDQKNIEWLEIPPTDKKDNCCG